MNVAFFDFDGTITKKDSLFVFLKFLVGRRKFYLGMLQNIRYLLGYMFGFISNTEAKEKVVSYFMQGMSEEFLLKKCQDILPYLEKIIRKDALSRIRWHKNREDRIVIVSATFSCYLAPLSQKLGVEYIGTELELKNGFVTGKFATSNCCGIEKVRRIKQKYNLNAYKEIFVYGDSRGDMEMLEIATQGFYRFFKN